MRHDLLGEASRPMRSRQARQRRDQRVVVATRILELVVAGLRVVRLDAVGTERDPLGDEQAGAGLQVVLAEEAARHRHREVGDPREQAEADLRLHLPLATITALVVEVAGELDEEAFREARVGLLVGDGEHRLAARAAAAERLELRDRGDAVVGTQGARRAERTGEEGRPSRPQRLQVDREVMAQEVAALPGRISHAHPLSNVPDPGSPSTRTYSAKLSLLHSLDGHGGRT